MSEQSDFSDKETGISIRFVKQWDIERDMQPTCICSKHGKVGAIPCQRCADVAQGRREMLHEIVEFLISPALQGDVRAQQAAQEPVK